MAAVCYIRNNRLETAIVKLPTVPKEIVPPSAAARKRSNIRRRRTEAAPKEQTRPCLLDGCAPLVATTKQVDATI